MATMGFRVLMGGNEIRRRVRAHLDPFDHGERGKFSADLSLNSLQGRGMRQTCH